MDVGGGVKEEASREKGSIHWFIPQILANYQGQARAKLGTKVSIHVFLVAVRDPSTRLVTAVSQGYISRKLESELGIRSIYSPVGHSCISSILTELKNLTM